MCEQYITVTMTREQAIALTKDVLDSGRLYRREAIRANNDVCRFADSEYFQTALIEAQEALRKHAEIEMATLQLMFSSGLYYEDICGKRETNNDKWNDTEASA